MIFIDGKDQYLIGERNVVFRDYPRDILSQINIGTGEWTYRDLQNITESILVE
jgi:hypothetical protein